MIPILVIPGAGFFWFMYPLLLFAWCTYIWLLSQCNRDLELFDCMWLIVKFYCQMSVKHDLCLYICFLKQVVYSLSLYVCYECLYRSVNCIPDLCAWKELSPSSPAKLSLLSLILRTLMVFMMIFSIALYSVQSCKIETRNDLMCNFSNRYIR